MGIFYCYLRLDSPHSVDEVIDNYLQRYPPKAGGDHMKAIRLRCGEDLYFGEYISNDYIPHGNKTVTDVLLMIALLVILIATIEFRQLFGRPDPTPHQRNQHPRKVLGCPIGRSYAEIW